MAPTGKRVVSSLPPEAQLTAQKLVRLGWPEGTWRYIEDYPLPDPASGIQVRDKSSLAPGENIALYAENMTHGDIFPPVVITADDHLLDGRTRNLAKRKITRKGMTPVFNAIVLQENFADATTAQMDRFYILGAVLNRHGEKLSSKNIEGLISQVWHEGMSQTDLARMLGVHSATVKSVVNAKKGRLRLEELGVDAKSLNRTNLTHFETKGRNLYDAPLKQVAEIAIQAGFSGPETGDLLNELNELHDEDRQLELLAGVRQSRRLQIDGTARKNPLAVQAMRSMGWWKNYEADPSVLAETSGKTAKEAMVTRCYDTIATLRKLAQALENDLSDGK